MWPLLVILAFLSSSTHVSSSETRSESYISADGGYRIVGGEAYNGTALGFIVSLKIRQYNYHVCGGALVAESWSITAGHCASAIMAGPLDIVVGILKLSEPGDRYEVEKIVVHPYFNITTLLNDLALVKTIDPVKVTDKVHPIRLAEADFFVGPGIYVELFGWGMTKFPNGTAPDHVQSIRLRTITNSECNGRYRGTPVPLIEMSQLCTFNQIGQGSCRGDSGGPLISQNILMAIVSFGVPCGAGYPDVHTRISFHRSWIDHVMVSDPDGLTVPPQTTTTTFQPTTSSCTTEDDTTTDELSTEEPNSKENNIVTTEKTS
ncbi:Peptidase S1, PA clan [Sergentomyia squamirostris]